MTYTTCTRCREKLHLGLVSEAAKNKLQKKESNREVLCLGCYKSLKELDVVQVITSNTSVENAERGDKGAVLCILKNKSGEVGYEVECVLPDGSNKWEGCFERNQLKWLQTP